MTTETKTEPKNPNVEIRWGDDTPRSQVKRSFVLGILSLALLSCGWTFLPLLFTVGGGYYAGKTLSLGLGNRKFAIWALVFNIVLFLIAATARVIMIYLFLTKG